jgi:hypothetical protein
VIQVKIQGNFYFSHISILNEIVLQNFQKRYQPQNDMGINLDRPLKFPNRIKRQFGIWCVCQRLNDLMMVKQTNERLDIQLHERVFFNLFCVATNLNKAEQDHKGQGRNKAKGGPFYLPLAIGEQ